MRPLRRIMLVEDDPDIALLARIALEELGGYELAIFHSGPEALAGAAAFGPDLAILDFRLPGMSGAQVFEALRLDPALADVPVMFMTASVMPKQVKALKAMGAVDVFAKPFDPIQLPENIAKLWQRLAEEQR